MIELERFSVRRSPRQATEVKNLVDLEFCRLLYEQPGTLMRFRDWPRSVLNIARIAASESMQGYILKKEGVAKGLATIIFGQRIVQEQTGQAFVGSDLDYWLDRDATTENHVEVARALVSTSNYLARDADLQLQRSISQNGSYLEVNRVHTAFATEPLHTRLPRDGFALVMNEVGPSDGTISVSGVHDKFGVGRGGAPCQLYIASEI